MTNNKHIEKFKFSIEADKYSIQILWYDAIKLSTAHGAAVEGPIWRRSVTTSIEYSLTLQLRILELYSSHGAEPEGGETNQTEWSYNWDL